jgi:hypothetical protein
MCCFEKTKGCSLSSCLYKHMYGDFNPLKIKFKSETENLSLRQNERNDA